MIATISFIEQKFDEFNAQMFDGSLKRIPVELSNARTFIGMCVCKKRRTLFGKIKKYDFRLRINARVDLSQEELEDTIIHEMIHYYIGVNDIEDTSSHGRVFRQMMNTINQRYGRHLTITHKSTAEQREQLIDQRAKWHVVAVVTFKDSTVGFKLLPRVQQRIETYTRSVTAAPEVSSVEVYWSKNVFFNRYPTSSALRVHPIDKSELAEQMKDAEKIDIK